MPLDRRSAWRKVLKAAGVGSMILVSLLLITVVVAAFGPLPAHVLGFSSAAAKLNAPDRVKAESDVRGALLQAVGGILLVIGAVTAWRQMLVARSQHVLGRRVAVTEAFSKAVEQLGDSGAVGLRLGGIYSLDRVADDDPAERPRVAEILSAFVRDAARAGSELPRDATAALSVLTRRDWPNGVDLAGACLSGARLLRARLASARLNNADLSGAVLTGATLREADLKNTDLRRAVLSGCDLRDAQIAGARLSGAVADSATRWPVGFAPAEHGVLTS